MACWRYTLLQKDPKYQEVDELVKALDVLAEPKWTRVMAFVQRAKRKRQWTNNHVERMNRQLRLAEKVRYRGRNRRWVVRWVVLLLEVCWKQPAAATAASAPERSQADQSLPQQRPKGQKKAA